VVSRKKQPWPRWGQLRALVEVVASHPYLRPLTVKCKTHVTSPLALIGMGMTHILPVNLGWGKSSSRLGGTSPDQTMSRESKCQFNWLHRA
jgi:hypothetical protein